MNEEGSQLTLIDLTVKVVTDGAIPSLVVRKLFSGIIRSVGIVAVSVLMVFVSSTKVTISSTLATSVSVSPVRLVSVSDIDSESSFEHSRSVQRQSFLERFCVIDRG